MKILPPKALEIYRWAADWFHLKLMCDKHMRSVLASMGIQDGIAARRTIGFAPRSIDDLVVAAARRGYFAPELIESGLATINGKGGVYDKFRSCLMFPITDANENIVGFGGVAINAPNRPEWYVAPAELEREEVTAENIVKAYINAILSDHECNADVLEAAFYRRYVEPVVRVSPVEIWEDMK